MRRTIAITIVLGLTVAACSGDATEPITRPVQTSPSTAPTTTTTVPATTTTLAPLEVFGLETEPGLEQLIRDIYEPNGEPIPGGPASAQASIGSYDEQSRMAVVSAGEDVTLAVADPE